jgi:hypothetical protein
MEGVNDEHAGIVCTASMLDLRSAENGMFLFSKFFNDSDFLAAGMVEIPPKSSKPGKHSKDNSYVSLHCSHDMRLADVRPRYSTLPRALSTLTSITTSSSSARAVLYSSRVVSLPNGFKDVAGVDDMSARQPVPDRKCI